MKSITIRKIPEAVLKQLKELAAKDKRSLNSYLIILLENHVAPPKNDSYSQIY